MTSSDAFLRPGAFRVVRARFGFSSLASFTVSASTSAVVSSALALLGALRRPRPRLAFSLALGFSVSSSDVSFSSDD